MEVKGGGASSFVGNEVEVGSYLIVQVGSQVVCPVRPSRRAIFQDGKAALDVGAPLSGYPTRTGSARCKVRGTRIDKEHRYLPRLTELTDLVFGLAA